MPGHTDTEFRSLKTLPVRLTGIVFWGLMVVGVLVVLTMLAGRESEIQQRQQAVIDRYILDLYHQLALSPTSDPQILSVLTGRLIRGNSTIRSVRLEAEGLDVRHGEPPVDGVSYTRSIVLKADADGGFDVALITLGLPSIKAQVADSRKSLLLGMGGLFLLFGLVLQRVLNGVLTRPFQHMINAARAFSSGDEHVRFDEQRSDEFGYLGQFYQPGAGLFH